MNPKINEILQEIETVIVGKRENVEKILMAVLAGGHVLMEDVPGVGKTTTAMTFAKVLGPHVEFCVSEFRQTQEYHVINVHDGGLFPLSTALPVG